MYFKINEAFNTPLAEFLKDFPDKDIVTAIEQLRSKKYPSGLIVAFHDATYKVDPNVPLYEQYDEWRHASSDGVISYHVDTYKKDDGTWRVQINRSIIDYLATPNATAWRNVKNLIRDMYRLSHYKSPYEKLNSDGITYTFTMDPNWVPEDSNVESSGDDPLKDLGLDNDVDIPW